MIEFNSLDSYEVANRGIGYAVRNPRVCHDFDHLVGHVHLIDGVPQLIYGVERFAHMPPFKEGEIVGLVVAR